jgi:putative transposase
MKLKLVPGDQLTYDGKVFQYVGRTADNNFNFKDFARGAFIERTMDQLKRAWTDGTLLFNPIDPAKTPEWQRRALQLDWALAPDHEKEISLQRRAIVEAVIKAKEPKPIWKAWKPIIEDAAIAAGMKNIPIPSTVKAWVDLYKSREGDIRALLPGFSGRGRRVQMMAPQAHHFYWECISKYYLDTKGSVASAYRRLKDAWLLAVRTRADAATWNPEPPSRTKFYRDIERIDPYLRSLKREGKKVAELKFSEIGNGLEARYRLEIVDIDHTILDTWIIDEESGFILGRPTLTLGIDRYTRMPVGLYIGLEPPSAYAALQCLYNMIMPKLYVQEEFPEIVGEWNAGGPPTVIVHDNGAEFLSESWKATCAALNITTQQGPVGRPDYRGIGERIMRTFKESSPLDMLPGKTSQKLRHIKDYNPEIDACMTLKMVRRIVHEWIIVEYSNRYHEGLGDIPQRVWNNEVEANPIRLPMSLQQLKQHFGLWRERTLTRKGIEILDLYYNSSKLNQILRDETWAGKIRFCVKPGNMGEISVVHPVTKELFEVPCVDQKYAPNVTLYQHKALRAIARKEQIDFTNTAKMELMRMRFIQNIDEALAKKSTRRKRHLSRGKGASVVDQPTIDPNNPLVTDLLKHAVGAGTSPTDPDDGISTFGFSDNLTDEEIPDYFDDEENE